MKPFEKADRRQLLEPWDRRLATITHEITQREIDERGDQAASNDEPDRKPNIRGSAKQTRLRLADPTTYAERRAASLAAREAKRVAVKTTEQAQVGAIFSTLLLDAIAQGDFDDDTTDPELRVAREAYKLSRAQNAAAASEPKTYTPPKPPTAQNIVNSIVAWNATLLNANTQKILNLEAKIASAQADIKRYGEDPTFTTIINRKTGSITQWQKLLEELKHPEVVAKKERDRLATQVEQAQQEYVALQALCRAKPDDMEAKKDLATQSRTLHQLRRTLEKMTPPAEASPAPKRKELTPAIPKAKPSKLERLYSQAKQQATEARARANLWASNAEENPAYSVRAGKLDTAATHLEAEALKLEKALEREKAAISKTAAKPAKEERAPKSLSNTAKTVSATPAATTVSSCEMPLELTEEMQEASIIAERAERAAAFEARYPQHYKARMAELGKVTNTPATEADLPQQGPAILNGATPTPISAVTPPSTIISCVQSVQATQPQKRGKPSAADLAAAQERIVAFHRENRRRAAQGLEPLHPNEPARVVPPAVEEINHPARSSAAEEARLESIQHDVIARIRAAREAAGAAESSRPAAQSWDEAEAARLAQRAKDDATKAAALERLRHSGVLPGNKSRAR